MSYFAEIAPNGDVLGVIVADQAHIATLPGEWVETFDGAEYAGKGYAYSRATKTFERPTAVNPAETSNGT